jgi:hypothetical protein
MVLSFSIYLLIVARSNQFLYVNNVNEGVRLRQLVVEVDENYRKKRSGLPYGNLHKLDRGDVWSFTISLDDHSR